MYFYQGQSSGSLNTRSCLNKCDLIFAEFIFRFPLIFAGCALIFAGLSLIFPGIVLGSWEGAARMKYRLPAVVS